MTKEVEVGDEFNGKVVKTTTFGAFVELAKGTDGLLHISNVKPGERVDDGRGRAQPRRRDRGQAWSRSTASVAASACAWPTTRRSRARPPRSWRRWAPATRARGGGGDRGDRGGGRGGRGGGRGGARREAARRDRDRDRSDVS